MVQENLTELVDEIEYDFRKIGYNVPVSLPSVIAFDTSSISFRSDLDNNGSVEIVVYQLSQPNVTGTMNPRDRVLTRSVNGQAVGGSLGIVNFQIIVYDDTGAITTIPAMVKSIEYLLRVESPFPIDTTYANSTWTAHIHPKNL